MLKLQIDQILTMSKYDQSGVSEHAFKHPVHFAQTVSEKKSLISKLIPDSSFISTAPCLSLSQVMKEFGVYNIIFSSSATVYGPPSYLPIDEKHPAGGCTNPYGKTKYFIEEIMKDICVAEKVNETMFLESFFEEIFKKKEFTKTVHTNKLRY